MFNMLKMRSFSYVEICSYVENAINANISSYVENAINANITVDIQVLIIVTYVQWLAFISHELF